MLIVPKREFAPWVAKHKAGLLQNHLLTHAATLAAKEERLLKDPHLSPAAKRMKLKPVSRALHRATKKLRTLDVPAAGTAGTADDDDAPETDLVSSAFDKWMRRMVRVAQKTEGGTPTGRTPVKTTVSKAIGTDVKPKVPRKPKRLFKKAKEEEEDEDWPLPPPPWVEVKKEEEDDWSFPPPQEVKVKKEEEEEPTRSTPFDAWDLEQGKRRLKKTPQIERPSATGEDDLWGAVARAMDKRRRAMEEKSKTPLAVRRLRTQPGWEDWEQGKRTRRRLDQEDYDEEDE